MAGAFAMAANSCDGFCPIFDSIPGGQCRAHAGAAHHQRRPDDGGDVMPLMQLPQMLSTPRTTATAPGALSSLFTHAARFGPRGVLVHGASLAASGALARLLGDCPGDMDCRAWQHPGGEPTLHQLTDLLCAAREHGADWIAAVGGGSVLDIAKGCAGLYHQTGDVQQYHDGETIIGDTLPFIAVPTTAGTGSEATPVSVLTNTETGVKKSFRSPTMTAQVVLLDAELLTGCPAKVVASSGLDAMTQAIESYTSRYATWFSQTLALRGLTLLAEHLPRAYDAATDGNIPLPHAEGILLGSFLAGVGFASSRLGVVHGLAHPLGARFHQPHGLTCGVCLPVAIELNRETMGAQYMEMSDAIGADLLETVHALLAHFGIQNPFSGQTLADRDAVIEEVLVSGSTKANPLPITREHVNWLLDRLLA